MKLVNHTPFPHLFFERRDIHDRPLGVLVIQGTFAIRSGRPLEASLDQEPVFLADQYRGEPAHTSPRRSGATSTFKPRSDIHVDGIARSPGGRARTEWPVRIRIGKIHKDLLVRGPSHWRHRSLRGWCQSAIEPTLEVPLEYERAFGGSFRIDGKLVEEPRNPVGTGYLPRGVATDREHPAPQIVAADEPVHRAGQRYAPQGCGPIPSYFAPRRDLIGTVDDDWLQNKWPCIPDDFDYAHYQSAHPDLVYPGYLTGDEPVELVHLGPCGQSILTSLPSWSAFTVLRLRDGRILPWGAKLDTVHFDLRSDDPRCHRAYLTWRSVLPVGIRIRQAEARMVRQGESPLLRVA